MLILDNLVQGTGEHKGLFCINQFLFYINKSKVIKYWIFGAWVCEAAVGNSLFGHRSGRQGKADRLSWLSFSTNETFSPPPFRNRKVFNCDKEWRGRSFINDDDDDDIDDDDDDDNGDNDDNDENEANDSSLCKRMQLPKVRPVDLFLGSLRHSPRMFWCTKPKHKGLLWSFAWF